MSTLQHLPAGRHGPLLLALAFSLVSWPFVAFALTIVAIPYRERPSIDFGVALQCALGSVLAGGLVAGAVGERLVRRRPRLAFFATLEVAWAAGIAGLAVVPVLAGRPVTIWYSTVDEALPAIGAAAGDSLLEAVAENIFAYGATLVFGLVIAAAWPLYLGTLVGAVARKPSPRLWKATVAMGIASWAILNLWSVLVAPMAALILVCGVAVWTLACSGVPAAARALAAQETAP